MTLVTTTSGSPLAWPLKAAKVKPREKRNAFPIHGYTGKNGGGKTMAAVYDSLPTLAAGRPIVSTCRILDPRTGDPHPLWVPLDDFRLLLELDHCDVILDEVTGVASSRDSAGMPSAVLNHLMQLRKGDVTIRWTTPNWRRADVGIREVTQALTTCIGLVPDPQVVVSDDGLVRKWKQRRLFSWKTYDAQNFDEWSAAREKSTRKDMRLRPVARQLIWGPGAIVRDTYDTYEHALTLGVVSDSGMCMDCGGKRRPKNCRCEGVVVNDPSVGMLTWRRVHAERKARLAGTVADLDALADRTAVANSLPLAGGRHRAALAASNGWPGLVEIPESDDTPGVVVETDPAA